MIFTPPSWVPNVNGLIPETLPVGEFVLNGDPGRPPTGSGREPFIEAISGRSVSIEELADRVDRLARAFGKELGWSPNEGSPWDKVVAIFSLNTLDYFVVCWAVHRLNGICMPLHSSSTVGEVTTHMTTAKCKTVVACENTMPTCLEAAKELENPTGRIFQLELPEGYSQDSKPMAGIKTVGSLIELGSGLPPLEALKWDEGQGKTQVAYLCSTSGTSGRQKLAMLTHFGLIANIMQTAAFESYDKGGSTEVEAGAVPFSHSYGIVVAHLAAWRGDQFIVFPRFDMQFMLECVPKYKVERLYVVPPILAALVANPFLLDLYDLSSVKASVTGAAALERRLAEKLQALRPTWNILHAWGSTETSVIATITSPHDIWYGSSGSLLPGAQIRLVDADGKDVEEYEKPGEVLFKAPNLFIGYFGNEEETAAAFDADGWHRTGDVGMMKVGAGGYEHLFIRDRIKDMIKVKGNQVVPADVEAVLATHPAVKEAAVIGIPDELAGERPRAFVVLSAAMADGDEEELRESIDEHVQDRLHETHWLHERIDFVEEIPKSQNGKVLKKVLKLRVAQNGVQNGLAN